VRPTISAAAFAIAVLAPPAGFTQGTPEPRFADSDRGRKLAAAFPEIERVFTSWVERVHAPGAAMGVIVDGELVWVKTSGVSDVKGRAEVTPDTVFRIASMTKSFTALAVLRLRDEGKLSLEDEAAKHVPELAGLKYPTADSPAITIRLLLTHSEGFPEDNPWGDRQLAQPLDTMSRWMREGIPFSTVPGTAYEYSNYGFAILGQIVERVSKQPYDRYVTEHILEPLGMRASTFERAAVPAGRMARGYRWEDGAWKEEPILAHGTFGAMGGLWTSTRDLARYVAFHLAAWPPRGGADPGPVERSSVREMQQAWRWQRARAARSAPDAPVELLASAYGYGLGIAQTCRFGHIVSHGGGLPGYGSLMLWLPEHGVGLIGMANLTYAGWRGVFNEALAALDRTGALQPRVVPPSPALLQAKRDVSALVSNWDDGLAKRIAADNLFLDESAERREARLRELKNTHGACAPDEPIDAENALRGTWRMTCERGWLNVAVTLSPTSPPRVQYLGVQSVLPPGDKMKGALEAARPRILEEAGEWGACRLGEAVAGDGARTTVVRVTCDRGPFLARVSIDPPSGRLDSLTFLPAPGNACAP
jgi:CubicO group peptidase (beta-lactamase class C family)